MVIAGDFNIKIEKSNVKNTCIGKYFRGCRNASSES